MSGKLLLAALACAGTPLAAQQPGPPDSMRSLLPQMGAGLLWQVPGGPLMPELGPALMTMLLYAPQHLLARRDALGLTADQVTRLTALRDGAKAAEDAGLAEARTHLQLLEQIATGPTPDTSALKGHFQAAHAALGKAHWAALSGAAQARAALTETQRATVQAWADSMHAWVRQHRRMMNPARPH